MSLLGKIVALFSGGTARKVCVVDGDRMVGGDRVGPGERFQALSRLARYAEREEVDVRVVFGGRPLREADDAATFHGVTVYYGDSPAAVRERIAKVLSSVGSAKALLVTSDQAFEAEYRDRGYATMRTSTLRKAMEPGAGEGGERSDRGEREGGGSNNYRDRDGGRRSRGRSRGGRRQPNESRDGAGNGNSETSGSQSGRPLENAAPANSGSGGGSGGGGNDSVKNLIDLVE